MLSTRFSFFMLNQFCLFRHCCDSKLETTSPFWYTERNYLKKHQQG
ncbi:hypothetical protein HM1_3058 [Heliomicrobium modesticaldum Ice1]|uniref:Uncharacterized protein n=1 Tax=Heliobacterium modesticaldum (strain ATCC 51547 / Ice1) TaxID=498761 RepID=B0TDN8_HELMI|nr:hypothetical protein HM1_3058 [Heliomicrobium modesticaldum Ice1]